MRFFPSPFLRNEDADSDCSQRAYHVIVCGIEMRVRGSRGGEGGKEATRVGCLRLGFCTLYLCLLSPCRDLLESYSLPTSLSLARFYTKKSSSRSCPSLVTSPFSQWLTSGRLSSSPHPSSTHSNPLRPSRNPSRPPSPPRIRSLPLLLRSICTARASASHWARSSSSLGRSRRRWRRSRRWGRRLRGRGRR